MKQILRLTLAAGMILASCAPGFAAAEDAIGTWRDTETGAISQILSCHGGVCVKVVTPSKGKEIDVNNPNPGLKGRQIAGVIIMSGAVKDGSNRWKGTLYNPEDGKDYTGYIEVTGKDEVKLEGCVLGILCKSRVWRRAQ